MIHVYGVLGLILLCFIVYILLEIDVSIKDSLNRKDQSITGGLSPKIFRRREKIKPKINDDQRAHDLEQES